MYKTLSGPLVAQIEISADCTNRCMHCYNFWRKDDSFTSFGSLSMSAAEQVMDKLILSKVFHVVFTGGEPFLNKRVLFRAIEKARVANITVGINSNLIPLTSDDAKRLKQLGVNSVLTSILAPTDEKHDEIAQHKGALRKTVKGVRLLQEVDIPVMVNMVISQKNKHFLRKTALFAKSLGIKHFSSTRAGCPGNCGDFSEMSLSLQDFRNYLAELYDINHQEQITTGVLESYPLCAIKEVKRYKVFTGRHCLAGVTTLTVAVDGGVRPCSHLDIVYGNLFNENLMGIWGRMREWRDGSLLPMVCRTCEILARCGGGCRMEAKMRNGSLSANDPYIASEDVEYVISQLTLDEKKSHRYLPSAFQLNPKARWRIEDFGSVVFFGSRLACYLNNAATELLNRLNINQIYQLSDFIGQYNDEDVKKFLTRLYDKQILKDI